MENINDLTGYWNEDNLVGIRNHTAVIGLSAFCSQAVRLISEQVSGTIPMPQMHGRNELGLNLERFNKSMLNITLNPNISSVFVVGYEPKTTQRFVREFKLKSKKPIESVAILEIGGVLETVKSGARKAMEMVINVSEKKREPLQLGDLTIGVKCGGSDATSGIVSNPVTGRVVDRVIDAGGKVIFSETTEIIGAEHILAKRAIDRSVAEKIIRAAKLNEEIARQAGVDLVGINPVPDNIAGGISTIEEKSLGAIAKAGTKKINDVIDYAEIPRNHGLYFMDSPSAAQEVLTALAASGSQLVIFSTGTGNPSGGPGMIPILKITGNPNTALHMKDHIDLDVSNVLLGVMSLDEASEALMSTLSKVVKGRLTRGEVLRTWDFSPIPTGL
jgi:altronate dehydratase large subunit